MDDRLAERLRDDPSSLVGRNFGGYRIHHRIAAGGMATVFLAHKAGPGGFSQPSAIKVIHSSMAKDRDFVEMFLDEARIASCISHPNVCRVLDFGKADDTFYLAMEYLMGETWSRTLHALRSGSDGARVVPEVLAQVVAQACEGLHAAHEATDHTGAPLSIVHRDVSPQNLLVGYDGSVRVLDFGIASASDRIHTTRDGAIKGRFSYMSPEQMSGAGCDRRADVWSLGVILREGLTGRPLFRRDTDAETIYAVTHEPLPPWDSSVPVPLQRIAEKALQRDLALRYATAREMGQDLMRFVTSQVVPVGMAEVSVWMHRLFASEIENKRQVLQRAYVRAQATTEQTLSLPPLSGQHEVIEPPPTSGAPTRMERSGATSLGHSDTNPSISMVRSVDGETETDLIGARARAWLNTLSPWKWAGPLALVALLGALLLVLSEKSPAPAPPAAPAPGTNEAPPPEAMPPEAVTRPEPEAEVEAEGAQPQAGEPLTDEAESAPAPRQRRARPRRRPPGTVNIVTSNGWAEVYLHGKKLGTTPGRFTLPAGMQTIGFKRMGQGAIQKQRVWVKSGGTAKLRVALE